MLAWLPAWGPNSPQRRQTWKVTCIAVYAGLVVLRFGIDEEVVAVLLLWLLLMLNNLHISVADENALRESFLAAENVKEMRDSLKSILEVFPESIFIKKGSKLYFSNNAFAKKIGTSDEQLRQKFTEKLGAVEVREFEGRKVSENAGDEESESTSLLRFIDSKEELVARDEDQQCLSIRLEFLKNKRTYKYRIQKIRWD